MSDNYDYISVSTDSELIEAYTKVMSQITDRELKIQMANTADSPLDESAGTIRRICNGSTRIHELVNKQIEETRTLESIAKRRRRNSRLVDFVIKPEKLG